MATKSTNHRRTMKTPKTAPRTPVREVSLRMRAVGKRDTACELDLRSAAHRLGLRYRTEWTLPGAKRRADLAFVAAKVAVFVDGCFWHVCPLHATWPKSNATWWRKKLIANATRDRDTDARLKRGGWRVVRFWEHQDMSAAAAQLRTIVDCRSGRR